MVQLPLSKTWPSQRYEYGLLLRRFREFNLLIVRVVVFFGHSIKRTVLSVGQSFLELKEDKGAPYMKSNAITDKCYEKSPVKTYIDQSCSIGIPEAAVRENLKNTVKSRFSANWNTYLAHGLLNVTCLASPFLAICVVDGLI